jgi:hypothetical protein
VHLVGDGQGVAIDRSSPPARVARARPIEAIGVELAGAELEIGEVVVLAEEP